MIKGWTKFNESTESFSKEMSDEIVFYFSEDFTQNIKIEELFYDLFKKSGVVFPFSFYEISYVEMKKYSDELYLLADKNESIKKELIHIYNLIREDLSMFPFFYEIEDIYLELIDKKFGLSVKWNNSEYSIKLSKTIPKMIDGTDFIEFLNIMISSILRLKKYKAKITESSYQIIENSTYIDFTVKLWQLNLMKK